MSNQDGVSTPGSKSADGGLGLNLVRMCSDAIAFGVGKLLTELKNHPARVYRNQLNPASQYEGGSNLKFLIPLFQGGK
jgi:hypothetical protein